jgi:hypothetical protein
MVGMDDPRQAGWRREIDEVGAVHAEGRVPAEASDTPGRRRTVMVKVVGADRRARPIPRRRGRDRLAQVAYRVRCHKDAGADLA